MMRLISILCLLSFGIVQLRADIIPALSASQAHVTSAYNASFDDDIIAIPAGTNTWTGQITITKAVTLRGSGTNTTVITYGRTDGNPIIKLQPASGKFATISHIQFKDSTTAISNHGQIQTAGSGAWRVCYCYFQIRAGTSVESFNPRGLFDRNVIRTMTGFTGTGIQIWGSTNNWNASAVFGTTNQVYVEANNFDFTSRGNGAVDCNDGGKYAARFNGARNAEFFSHGCDSGFHRSTYLVEIYGNVMTNTLTGLSSFLASRGGTGLVFSNEFQSTQPFNLWFKLNNFRCGGAASVCAVSLGNCPPWGSATGTNIIDGNTDVSGYPTLDQCGWTGPTTFGPTNSTQVSSPFYCWDNVQTLGSAPTFGGIAGGCTVVEDRDYFTNTVKVGYTPLTYPHPLVAEPGVPLAIYPTNNAESIEFSSVNLQWSSTDALTYDVYFGTDSPPVTLVADNTTSTSYGLVPLAPDTSYYWRIEASNLNGSATNTFTFRTAPLGPTPGVVAQPANRRRRAL